MTNLRPSPAIVVSADIPIAEAVRKMRDSGVGSVLVVREVLPHDLVGIFTERDLVHKIDEIQHGGYWEKGIASVMTAPVITVSVYDLSSAPEIMNRCHIRHLPVVYTDEKEQKHIVGVISMRDLFDNYYESGVKSSLQRKIRGPLKIGLACKNPLSLDMLRTVLSQGGKADIVEVDPDFLLDHLERFLNQQHPSRLVVDLDFVGAAKWARFLQQINRSADAPKCVVLFTPDLHDPKNTKVLMKLSESGRITAYAKPINVLSLLQKLES